MRGQANKLRRSTSTKGERLVGEILKRNHIKFLARARVGKYEIDFLCGRVAIEVDGRIHQHTNQAKDTDLFKMGFVPLHLSPERCVSETQEKELIYLIRSNNVRFTQTRS